MQDILIGLMMWIGANTQYNVQRSLPNLTFTEQQNLCSAYGGKRKAQCEATRRVGFYNKKPTKYLNQGFQADDLAAQSRLLNELVHYIQWSNGKHESTCLGRLEVEAYEIQELWRSQNQLNASFDPFKKILLESSCDE